MNSDYLMESAREAERLELKTNTAATIEQLKLVALSPGARALDAGAGTGAVARAMTQFVGAEGSVVALDASHSRLRFGRERSKGQVLAASFAAGNLYHLPFQTNAFDFVWCRFIFEYLKEPDVALRELIRVTRVGGKVVVGDLDGNALFHFPLPAEIETGLKALAEATRGIFDPYAGRKLYHRCYHAGLTGIKTHLLPYHLYAGAIPQGDLDNWKLKVQNLQPFGEKAMGGRQAYERWADAFVRFLEAPDTLTYSVLFLVEGRKGA